MRRRLISVLLVVGCGDAAALRVATPPTDPIALHQWLVAGEYRTYDAESTVLPGLNGVSRRVFLSPDVEPERSPLGAAAVREMWAEGGEARLGWSVVVKVDDRGDEANWYFYETFDTSVAQNFAVSEVDAPGCTFCHAAAPDTIQSTLPLL